MKKRTISFSFNSPVILGFAGLCLLVLGLDYLTGGWTNRNMFSVYKSSLTDPLTYFRFFGHVLGHADWSHLLNNMMLLLIVGPLLEEKYGSDTVAIVIGLTAFVTGLVHFIFFPATTHLLGASGVVFAFILMSSFTSIKSGEIPITFILVAVLYLGEQIYDEIFLKDNISQLTHIIGGIIGAGCGFMYSPHKKK